MPPKKKSKKEEAAAKKAEAAKKAKAKKEETESEEESEEEEDESTDMENRGRGKRKRRSSTLAAFEPEDFTMADQEYEGPKIIKGRGVKLGDLRAVRASIEKYKASSNECQTAHKLLYTMRSKPALKDVKNNILNFSGYLVPLPKNYDEKVMEKEDENEETKYSRKAFKMTVAELRNMCDFFAIDRFTETPSGADKDTLVDYLLDFLGAPDPDLVVDPNRKPVSPSKKKKKAAPKKKKRKKPAEEKPPADPFAQVKAHEMGKKPSKKALQQWCRAFVVCFDMDNTSVKTAVKMATERFGVDMKERKAEIRDYLTQEM